MRQNRRVVLSLFLALVAALGDEGDSSASETRADSLLYNLAIPDEVDAFIFPQLLPSTERITFFLPSRLQDVYGGGVYTFGRHGLGLFVHRPIANPFDQYRISPAPALVENHPDWGILGGHPEGETISRTPGQVVDLLYGNGRFGAGFRLHGWSEISQHQGADDSTSAENSVIAGDFNVGYAYMPGLDLHADIGGAIVKEIGSTYRFLVGGRYISPSAMRLRPVFAGQLELGVFSPNVGDEWVAFGLPVKGGLQVSLASDRLIAGLLAGIDIQVVKPGSDDSQFALAIPTLELATEYAVHRRVLLRLAVKSGYGATLSGAPNDTKPKYEHVALNLGFGLDFSPLIIDGGVSWTLLDVGNTEFGPLASISLTYRFGDNVLLGARLEPKREPGPASAPVREASTSHKAPAPIKVQASLPVQPPSSMPITAPPAVAPPRGLPQPAVTSPPAVVPPTAPTQPGAAPSPASPAGTDRVTLKDGTELHGRIIMLQVGKYLIIETSEGQQTIVWEEVKRVTVAPRSQP